MNGATLGPKVAVLTAVHNGERWLADALDSVLQQSLREFEIILVDDGSTDRTSQIIREFASRDSRIRTVRPAQNVGPSAARNLGLAMTAADYVATFDADDLMAPRRLELQASFLDDHPSVGVAGCQILEVDAAGRPLRLLRSPTNARLARWTVLFQTPVLNSGAMFRRSALNRAGGYSPAADPIGDYELIARLVKTTDFVALPECLCAYRRHEDQMTSRQRAKGLGARLAVLVHTLLRERLGHGVTLADAAHLYAGGRGAVLADQTSLLRVVQLFDQLLAREQAAAAVDEVGVRMIRLDCAARLMVLGWRHRLLFRNAAKDAVRRSFALDREARHRPVTREKMTGRPSGPLQWPP